MSGVLAGVLLKVLNVAFRMINFLIIASIIVSWIGDTRNPIVQMLNQIMEPMYRPIRRFTQKIPGPLDWAPVVLILIVIALEEFFNRILTPYAM